MKKIWIVGQAVLYDVCGNVERWEFQGVFSTEQKAKAACQTSDYFMCSYVVDDEVQHETLPDGMAIRGGYYPLRIP